MSTPVDPPETDPPFMGTQSVAKVLAQNFAIPSIFGQNPFDEPGGLFRQLMLPSPSGGHEMTGWTLKKEAVPESASVPPAHPTMQQGCAELFNDKSKDSNLLGCLCALQMRMCVDKRKGVVLDGH